MSSTADLPIALRQETFGGILFDPADATFMELDQEAFTAVSDFARGTVPPADSAAADLISEVRTEVVRLDGRSFRHVAVPEQLADAPVPVLSGPTLVDFQITNKCHLDCPHCYAASTPDGQHGNIEDIELALDQIAEVGAFQVALGGGEPLLHPGLEQILARCHELGLVPNLTTSGLHLGQKNLQMLQRYCGAVGLSLEGVGSDFDRYRKSGFERFQRILNTFADHGIPTVLQVTLNTETLASLEQITEFCTQQPGLYGVIFLAFKPVGRGEDFGKALAHVPHDEVHQRLQQAFEILSEHSRVGFDCCLTPGVTGVGSAFDAHAAQYLEGCSALRTSIGLSHTLDVMPCTFTATHTVGNLRDRPLHEIWRSEATKTFRNNMATRANENARCNSCSKYNYCLGGCPVMNLVNCGRDYLGFAAGKDVLSHSIPLIEVAPRRIGKDHSA